MAAELRRVQFVISGWFLLFLILATGFISAGYWRYTHPPPPPAPPPTPPYYINRTTTALRPCFQCVTADGKLKARQEWRLGKPVDIPAEEQWWFAALEGNSDPVKVDGVPMLAVHPATNKEKPWYGFNLKQVYLVVFQDLEPKFTIDHPPTSPTPTPEEQPAPSTTDSTPPEDSKPISTATQQ